MAGVRKRRERAGPRGVCTETTMFEGPLLSLILFISARGVRACACAHSCAFESIFIFKAGCWGERARATPGERRGPGGGAGRWGLPRARTWATSALREGPGLAGSRVRDAEGWERKGCGEEP